jgi:hypothetical protein
MKPVTQTIADKIVSRAEVGLQKYGQTMDRKDLDFGQWCDHAIEEILDQAQYMEASKRKYRWMSLVIVQIDSLSHRSDLSDEEFRNRVKEILK